MLEILMCTLVAVLMPTTIIIAVLICNKADRDGNKYIITALKNYIIELFIERNCFGIVLSVVVFIIGIPAFLMIIFMQASMCIVELLITMWKLGNKRNINK